MECGMMAQNQVKSVQIGELISVSVGGTHKVGKMANYDLAKCNVKGEDVANVRAVRGPTPEGLLLVEIKCCKNAHFKLQLDVVPSKNTFSVLMYNVGPEHKVSIPGLKRPLNLTGPAFILVGEDIYTYDGERPVAVHHGFIVEMHPLMFFMIGRHMMIQNLFKRKSIKLPSSVPEKGALMVAYINLANDTTPTDANGVRVNDESGEVAPPLENYRKNAKL